MRYSLAMELVNKCHRVIESCETMGQICYSLNYLKLIGRRLEDYLDPHSAFAIFQNLVFMVQSKRAEIISKLEREMIESVRLIPKSGG